MSLFLKLNAVNADVFSVQRRERRYFSSSTPLTPLLLRFNAVNAFSVPVEHR